jgi:hypothetical protein
LLRHDVCEEKIFNDHIDHIDSEKRIYGYIPLSIAYVHPIWVGSLIHYSFKSKRIVDVQAFFRDPDLVNGESHVKRIAECKCYVIRSTLRPSIHET